MSLKMHFRLSFQITRETWTEFITAVLGAIVERQKDQF